MYGNIANLSNVAWLEKCEIRTQYIMQKGMFLLSSGCNRQDIWIYDFSLKVSSLVRHILDVLYGAS